MVFEPDDTVAPDDVVRSVAAEISGGGLKPLSDEERLERQHWREELHQRKQERKAEQEYRQAVVDEEARQEAADALAEANRQARILAREKAARDYQERQARMDRQSRSNDLAALRSEAQQSALWRNTVRNALAYQQGQTLINEIESALLPPAPSPGPAAVNQPDDNIGSPDMADANYNPLYWFHKPIFRR